MRNEIRHTVIKQMEADMTYHKRNPGDMTVFGKVFVAPQRYYARVYSDSAIMYGTYNMYIISSACPSSHPEDYADMPPVPIPCHMEFTYAV